MRLEKIISKLMKELRTYKLAAPSEQKRADVALGALSKDVMKQVSVATTSLDALQGAVKAGLRLAAERLHAAAQSEPA